MLLDEVIALAKKEDCKKLRWQVSGWNTNAISFYKKIGSSIDGLISTAIFIFRH